MRIALAAAMLLLPALASAEEPKAAGSSQEPKITTITSTTHISYVRPKYLPPQELAEALGARFDGGRGRIEWRDDAGPHVVEVRLNPTANLLILAGPSVDVGMAEGMIRGADQPPRQIAIEAMTVEVDESKIPKPPPEDLAQMLRELEESGAAVRREGPRLRTINHRRAHLADGRFDLSVLPSVGEGAVFTLEVSLGLTRPAGSSAKNGPRMESTVMVKDGGSVAFGPFASSRPRSAATRSFVVLSPHALGAEPPLGARKEAR